MSSGTRLCTILLAILPVATSLAACSNPPERKAVLERIRSGHFSQARRLLQRYVAKHPDDEKARYHLGRLLYRKGHFNEAITHLKKVQAYRTNSPRVGTTQAAAQLKLGRYEEALAAFGAVVHAFKKRDWLFDPFEEAFLDKSFEERSRTVLRDFMISSARVSTFYRITTLLVERGESSHALDLYKSRLKERPSKNLRKAFIKFLIKIEEYPLAMEQIQTLNNQGLNTPLLDLYRGEILYRQGKYRTSLQFLRSGYRQNYRPPRLLALYAGSLRKSNRLEDAARIINDALQRYRKHADLHVERAELLKQLKPGHPAIWWSYYRALNYETADASIFFELGQLFLNESRAYRKALLFLNIALEVDPGLEEARYYRALVLSRLKRKQKALETLNQIENPSTLKPPLRGKIRHLRQRLQLIF